MTLNTLNRLNDQRDDVRPTDQACVRTGFGRLHTTRPLLIACVAIIGLGFGPTAQAGFVLDIASVAGANIEFKGSGTGATFQFNNNASGEGFVVTASTGTGDSVGLNGTLGGTYSYSMGSVVTTGQQQTAPLISNGGTLTITDAASQMLTGSIAGIDLTSLGTGGVVNLDGIVNLKSVSYSGTNADLIQLRDEAKIGGVVALSYQFIPGQSLASLAAANADNKTSFSGTISAIPEPSSLILAAIGALAVLGCGAQRLKVAARAISPSSRTTCQRVA